jgi:hypothetical protein
MDEKVHEYIVSKLARDGDENDLILAVCEQQQVNWKEAKALIAEIKSEHEDSIAARQLPLKTIIAVATLVIGLTLVIVTTLFMVDLIALVTGILSSRSIDLDRLSILGEANLVLAQLLMNQSPAAIPLVAAGFINGLGMIFGSLLGMHETWAYLIDKISSIVWK